jgi:hypothetical protein
VPLAPDRDTAFLSWGMPVTTIYSIIDGSR